MQLAAVDVRVSAFMKVPYDLCKVIKNNGRKKNGIIPQKLKQIMSLKGIQKPIA